MSWNLQRIKLPTGYGSGFPLTPVLLSMIRRVLKDTMPLNCVLMKIAAQNFSAGTVIAYPMQVYNINSVLLGTAANTAQFITLWNADAANLTRGFITAGTGTLFDVQPVYLNITPTIYAVQI